MTANGSGNMKVLFIGETRTTFASSGSTEGNAPRMGEFDAYDIRLTEGFRTPTEATITISATREWFSKTLVPSSKPGSKQKKYQRARYVSFTGPGSNKVVLLITGAVIDLTQKAYDGNFANITVTAKDPRHWLSTMPGDLTNPAAKFNGTVQNLLIELTKRCSSANFSGKLPIQKLPISELSAFTPNAIQTAAGLVATSSLPNFNVSFDLSDPMPPESDVQSALTIAGVDYELYPLLVHGTDGTDAPWWRWVIRKRQTLSETLMETLGQIMVQSFTSDLSINESLFYDDQSKVFSLGNFNSPTYPGHYGPWLGVAVESASVPPNAEKKKWLRRRAKAASKGLKNVQAIVDVNSDKMAIKRLTPGTYVRFDISGAVFNLSVDQLTWSYDFQVGDWTLEDWSL